MNIYVHDDYIKEKAKRARRMQSIGMVLIIISFLFSFGSFSGNTNTYLISLAYPFLLVGFPIWTMGRSTQRRLASAPRADVLLNAEFKGLNNKYSLHHYVHYGETWIHHLLITPSGVIVIGSNDAMGPVTCRDSGKGDQWKSPTNLMDRISGLKPQIGNPTIELDAAMAAARDLLRKIGKPEAAVKGLVVFTRNPAMQINGCSYQGVPMNEAKTAVRELQQDMDDDRDPPDDVRTLLTSDDRRKLNTLLAPESVRVQPGATPVKR